MDLSKRENLRNVREVRLAGTDAVPDAQWRIEDAIEFRDADAENYTFRGEASVVEHPYTVHDMFGEFTETVRTGAFDKTLRENPDVSFVYMHDMATVMASTRGGGLTLTADPHLTVAAQLPKSDIDVQRFAPKALRGDANAMSFAFRVVKQEWNEDYTDRVILEVNLHRGDVSGLPTGLGANPAAWGTLRADELELAFRAARDGAATDEQVAALTALLAREEPEVDEIDPDEARLFVERLMRTRERARA
jgi:HK97 family phage prohead protease